MRRKRDRKKNKYIFLYFFFYFFQKKRKNEWFLDSILIRERKDFEKGEKVVKCCNLFICFVEFFIKKIICCYEMYRKSN